MATEKKSSKSKKTTTVKKKIDYTTIYDNTKAYPIKEAVDIVKKITNTKFDASVEVHFRLGINNKKTDQQIRGAVSLPHGTGKVIKVAAFVSPENEKAAKDAGADIIGGEELIAEIKKTEKTDFQVAVAEPLMMKKLGMIAKILGTRGLMPSPKNETVTPTPAKAIMALKKGKINFKNDDTGNLHAIIGKISFDDVKLIENFQIFIDTLKKMKPSSAKGIFIQGVVIASSMSPGVKVSIS
ncbi:MAG TPA: 50S ribosomal protein L1 [Patescibacteria group bacterium]|nr:50S ribosomal protein L1 [Patescibacteria group bacterium]